MYGEIKETGELIGKLRSNSAGKIVSCHMGKKDLTEHFKDKKLSDASVRHYLEHRVMDLIVEFKGEIYRVIRFFSKKDQKVQYLITSIRKKNIKAIKLTLMNSKGEEHCCELSDASDEIKDSILDLIVKLRKQNDVQIKFVQGFEVKVTPNLIKGILIELK